MRKKLKNRKFAVAAALILALAGFLLRLIQVRADAPVLLTLLSLLAAAAALFSCVTALNLKPRPAFAPNNRPSAALLLELPAALLLLAASIVQFSAQSGINRWLIGLGGIAGALCMGAITVQIILRKRPSLYFYMVMTLSMILRLIPEFRVWSIDPLISDYCFRLFAAIAVMCVSYHRGSFVMNRGKRRMTVFWCIAGIFFCGVSIADGSLSGVLTHLAYLIFLSTTLWSVMAPGRRKRLRSISSEHLQ